MTGNYLYIVQPTDDDDDEAWEGFLNTIKKRVLSLAKNLKKIVTDKTEEQTKHQNKYFGDLSQEIKSILEKKAIKETEFMTQDCKHVKADLTQLKEHTSGVNTKVD